MTVEAPRLTHRGPCPLCGSQESSPAIAFPDIPVLRCDACRFLYSGMTMTEDGLAAYYADQGSNPRIRCGQEVFAQASVAALERLTPLHTLRRTLDVGSGYGYLLSYLRRRHGIAGTGVEPSTVESEFGRTHLDVDIRTALLSDAGLDRGSFDLVCTFEVLEHTVEPVDFLAEVAEYVRPGGYLVVGTDNFESDVVEKLGHGFPKWIPHTHVSHFSPATLTALASGLRSFRISGYASYTPWEFIARRAVAPFRPAVPLSASYHYQAELVREVSRPFRLYRLRRSVTALWFALTVSNNLSGEMMFIALQRGD